MELRPNIYIPVFKRILGFKKLFLLDRFQSITICESVALAFNTDTVCILHTQNTTNKYTFAQLHRVWLINFAKSVVFFFRNFHLCAFT